MNAQNRPKSNATDLAMMENVALGGTVRLQIRAENFNVFNTVNYGNPGASFGAASFGRNTSAGSIW